MQKRKGFTLVELVIVIAVIAILAGVLIGTFASVINRANASAEVQKTKSEEIAQKAEDILKKIEDSNWYGWEDFETSIVAKITQEIKNNGAGLTADQVKKIIEDALTTWQANKQAGNTELTAEQVKAIVENAVGTLHYEGVTEAQVRAIVTASGSNLANQLITPVQIKQIVTAANANNLTAAQVASVVTSASNTTVDQIVSALNSSVEGLATSVEVEKLRDDIKGLAVSETDDVVVAKALNIKLKKSGLTTTTAVHPTVVFETIQVTTKLKMGASDANDIMWDSANNSFVVVKLSDETYVYSENAATETAVGDKYKLWKVVDSIDSACLYSQYLRGTTASGTIDVVAGLDVGKNTGISSIKYERTTGNAQTVVIRTNSASTELVVNAQYDTVKHYDAVGQVHVIAVDKNNCFEENGKAAFTQVDSGKYKTSATADVKLLFVSDSSNVTLEIAEGTVDHAHAISEEEANAINGTEPGVIFDYDGNNAQSTLNVYHHVNDGDKIGLTADYNNNKTKETIIDIVEDAVEKEAVEADESDFWIICHADAFASGSGTEQDPYIIKTARQLSLLAYNVNTLKAGFASAWYKLGKDIDLSGKAWTPIGTTNGTDTLFFTGHFDGNGKSIIGLTNDGKSDVDLGLFSDELSSVKGLAASYGLFGFTKNVNISNLTMEKAKVEGSSYFKEAGFIIGTAAGSTTMIDCTIDEHSSFEGLSKIGGFVGFLSTYEDGGNVHFDNCDFAGSVTASKDRAGAMAGAMTFHNGASQFNVGHTHLFKDCDSTGTVNSGKYGTGFIGYAYQGVNVNTFGIKTVTFDNCTVDTSKFSTTGNVAKYIGRLAQGTTAVVVKNGSYSANIIGDIDKDTDLILQVGSDYYGYIGPSSIYKLPSLTGNEETYKLGQMIYNASNGAYNECWKNGRMEELAPKDVLFKIDSTSIDLSTGELKYGAGWYDTKISDFSSYVASGYHIVVPETHATYESTGTHYIYQVVAD